MLDFSALYEEIIEGKYKTNYKVTVNGEEYQQKDDIRSLSIDWGIISERLSVGNVQARQITVTVKPKAEIPKRSEIVLFAQVENTETEEQSEWLELGTFYISHRQGNGSLLELECYDAVLKLQADYVQDGEQVEWPRKMRDVAAEICGNLGLNCTIPETLADYDMALPTDKTQREVMADIAAAYCGNWTLRPDGFYLLPVFDTLGNFDAGSGAQKAYTVGDPVTFSGVRVYWSDDDFYEAGDTTGNVLEIECDNATQIMADNINSYIKGKSCQAYTAEGCWIHPAVEPGDGISIGGVSSIVAHFSGSVTAGYAFTVEYPGDDSDEDEYPYEGAVSREVSKKVSLSKSYFGVSISRSEGLKISKSDKTSEAIFNSEQLTMRAVVDGVMVDCIYFDPITQCYRITGAVQVDGSLVTQNLYADEGDIVDLTVDKLRTSQRIAKYLNNDTSVDNYISISGNTAEWISAAVKTNGSGGTAITQLKNMDNKPLYWAKDITEATIQDGKYYIDGERVTTTTTKTSWPVYVYAYQEADKFSITFDSSGVPYISLGSGSGDGDKEKGFIRKGTDGLELIYKHSSGNDISVKLGKDGSVSFSDLLSEINLENLENGSFSIKYGDTVKEYGFTETDDGYKLTKPDGEVVSIVT